MTTIVHKDGIIACDGRSTADNLIISDNCEKMIEKDGIKFFIAGLVADRDEFIKQYLKDDVFEDLDCQAMIIRDRKVTVCCFIDGKKIETPVSKKTPYAIGSGMLHALTAMDLGKTAKESIRIAMKRDACTGGVIKTYKV